MNVALADRAAAREQLCELFVLSTAMLDSTSEDDILRLVSGVVPAWSSCEVVAGYLLRDQTMARCAVGRPTEGPVPNEWVETLDGTDRPVGLTDQAWAGAVALRGPTGLHGYLVLSAPTAPGPDEQLLLRLLAQQAGAAMAIAALRRTEREQSRQLDLLAQKLEDANGRLTAAVAEHERQVTIQRELARRGDEQGIADALHELTGLAVAVEDRFGNLRCWSGPGRPERCSKPDARRHEELLRQVMRRGSPVRDRDRVLTVARPRHEILGAVVLIDPEHRAGPQEMFALQQSATVLGPELAHQRELAEVESRLRGDLVADLIAGADPARVYARSEAAGHDLHGGHHVLVVHWPDRSDVLAAVARAASELGIHSLLGKHSDAVVLVVAGPPPAHELYDLVARELGTTTGAIGVGGRADSPAELPRSFSEASRALEIRGNSRTPHGVLIFDDLGLYRILDAGNHGMKIERYVREWLGPLLDYDLRHHADLTNTLFQYLECGGNYTAAAEALIIHRSTLRYRLRRIRDIAAINFNDVDSRLNLHVAARAWHMLAGPGW